MAYVRLRDLEMFYEDAGAGDPVLFLHSSFTRGVMAFSAQIPIFPLKYRCLLPDMRGHGMTKAPGLEWSVPELAEDMIVFLTALGIDKSHLIGYSLGGDVALYAVTKRPDLFKSLVTIGTSGMVTEETKRQAALYEPPSLEQRNEFGFIRALEENHRVAHSGNWRRFAEVSTANWRLYPAIPDGVLAAIAPPCLFIAGENDPFVTEAQLLRLGQIIPRARTLRIPGCGHRPHMPGNEPDLVNEAILAFLAGH